MEITTENLMFALVIILAAIVTLQVLSFTTSYQYYLQTQHPANSELHLNNTYIPVYCTVSIFENIKTTTCYPTD